MGCDLIQIYSLFLEYSRNLIFNLKINLGIIIKGNYNVFWLRIDTEKDLHAYLDLGKICKKNENLLNYEKEIHMLCFFFSEQIDIFICFKRFHWFINRKTLISLISIIQLLVSINTGNCFFGYLETSFQYVERNFD